MCCWRWHIHCRIRSTEPFNRWSDLRRSSIECYSRSVSAQVKHRFVRKSHWCAKWPLDRYRQRHWGRCRFVLWVFGKRFNYAEPSRVDGHIQWRQSGDRQISEQKRLARLGQHDERTGDDSSIPVAWCILARGFEHVGWHSKCNEINLQLPFRLEAIRIFAGIL